MSEIQDSNVQKFGYNNILSTVFIHYLLLILQSPLVIQALVKVAIGRGCSKKAREHFTLVWMNLDDREIGLSLDSTDFCEGMRVINIK